MGQSMSVSMSAEKIKELVGKISFRADDVLPLMELSRLKPHFMVDLVEAGFMEKLPSLLAHGSPKVLELSAKLLCNIADRQGKLADLAPFQHAMISGLRRANRQTVVYLIKALSLVEASMENRVVAANAGFLPFLAGVLESSQHYSIPTKINAIKAAEVFAVNNIDNVNHLIRAEFINYLLLGLAGGDAAYQEAALDFLLDITMKLVSDTVREGVFTALMRSGHLNLLAEVISSGEPAQKEKAVDMLSRLVEHNPGACVHLFDNTRYTSLFVHSLLNPRLSDQLVNILTKSIGAADLLPGMFLEHHMALPLIDRLNDDRLTPARRESYQTLLTLLGADADLEDALHLMVRGLGESESLGQNLLLIQLLNDYVKLPQAAPSLRTLDVSLLDPLVKAALAEETTRELAAEAVKSLEFFIARSPAFSERFFEQHTLHRVMQRLLSITYSEAQTMSTLHRFISRYTLEKGDEARDRLMSVAAPRCLSALFKHLPSDDGAQVIRNMAYQAPTVQAAFLREGVLESLLKAALSVHSSLALKQQSACAILCVLQGNADAKATFAKLARSEETVDLLRAQLKDVKGFACTKEERVELLRYVKNFKRHQAAPCTSSTSLVVKGSAGFKGYGTLERSDSHVSL